MTEKRTHQLTRTTKETDISLEFSLDGSGQSNIQTGVGFFDHMLDLFTVHGIFDLTVSVKGICMWMHIIRLKMLGFV